MIGHGTLHYLTDAVDRRLLQSGRLLSARCSRRSRFPLRRPRRASQPDTTIGRRRQLLFNSYLSGCASACRSPRPPATAASIPPNSLMRPATVTGSLQHLSSRSSRDAVRPRPDTSSASQPAVSGRRYTTTLRALSRLATAGSISAVTPQPTQAGRRRFPADRCARLRQVISPVVGSRSAPVAHQLAVAGDRSASTAAASRSRPSPAWEGHLRTNKDRAIGS